MGNRAGNRRGDFSTAPEVPGPVAFRAASPDGPPVRGYLHQPGGAPRDGIVLTHGAGSSAEAPLLRALAGALATRGLATLRCDLPFRQDRPHGPPRPAGAAKDRTGLREAVRALGRLLPGRIFLGGHSYGGRQASILAAEEPDLAGALLLLAYPLHPPGRRTPLRVAHFPRLRTPALFVHGSRDPFGTLDELHRAMPAIPARTVLLPIEGAGHDLARGAAADAVAARAADALLALALV